jgi:putative two-component system response regulator
MTLTPSEHRILIVDDDAANIHFLERLLAYGGYTDINSANSGASALAYAIGNGPDLILLDLHMPEMDGFQVLEALRTSAGPGLYVPILIYTADITFDARKRALELGASDFLTKPADAQEILLRMRNFLVIRDLHLNLSAQKENLESLVRDRTRELEQSQFEVVERLAMAGEKRDDDTGAHTRRVGLMSAAICEAMGYPSQTVELMKSSARLHDLGKIGISDTILLKPGRLTQEEFREMQLHCAAGAKILSNGRTPLLQMAERIARSHHERFDGTGYPDGLAGADIPIEARIVAVADVFDALTHARPYKPAWEFDTAIEEIKKGSGSQFDPDAVAAFLKVVASGYSLDLADDL